MTIATRFFAPVSLELLFEELGQIVHGWIDVLVSVVEIDMRRALDHEGLGTLTGCFDGVLPPLSGDI